MRRLLLAAAALALIAAFTPAVAQAQSTPGGVPPVKHVFILILENEGAETSFGANPGSSYLAVDLRAQGNLLEQYYGTSHNSLGNYLTMISGLPTTVLSQLDCPAAPWNLCTSSANVPTIANQLDAAGLSWRGYMEDMATPCEHPGVGLTDSDGTQSATAASQYANRHDPFIYFHSIIDDAASCANHVVNLDQLPADLASASTTPSYTFITPDLCHDGHDASCADGGPGGYAGIDEFLQQWVPLIEQSPAFADGLLLITFDEASTSDASACCYSTPLAGLSGDGGGRVGALAISPFVAPGTSTQVPYNHYSMLASVEDLFGLSRLGGAAQPASVPFGSDVYNAAGSNRGVSGPGATVNAGGGSGGSLPATGGVRWPWLVLAAVLAFGALAARRVTRGR
ncbi:MAG: phosphatidylinositol-3-phosphatase [Acidimicrobiaceae bacterium]